MSKADKMFEELGYTKLKINGTAILAVYAQTYNDVKFFADETFIVSGSSTLADYIDMDLLQAINQKCKELGWLE